MIDHELLIEEIKNIHKLYYSMRQHGSIFDVNLESVKHMSYKELIQLLGLLNELTRIEKNRLKN